MKVLIGGAVCASTVVSASSFVVFTPELSLGLHQVVVEKSIMSGKDFFLEVVPLMSIVSIVPSEASLFGGTDISIFGSLFHNKSNLVCAFDTSTTFVFYVNDSCVVCSSPRRQLNAHSDLSIQLGGHIVSNTLPFNFVSIGNVVVSSFVPSTGSSKG